MQDSILDENNGYCPTAWLMTKDCCGITSSAESSFNYGSEPTQAKTQLGLLSPLHCAVQLTIGKPDDDTVSVMWNYNRTDVASFGTAVNSLWVVVPD